MTVQKECRITRIRKLCESVVDMRIDAGELVRGAVPGQFVNIKCGDWLQLRRPISICDINGEEMRLVFELHGEGTHWLVRREPGEKLDILGPLGKGFDINEEPILIAGGGVGVPPLLFLAKTVKEADAVLGYRSAENAMLLSEFKKVCTQVDVTSNDGTLGKMGFADKAVRQRLSERKYSLVCACGPRPMMKAVAAAAAEFGVPCQVSMEERMGCGVGACLVCACKVKAAGGEESYKRVCKDGPVFDSAEVVWDE